MWTIISFSFCLLVNLVNCLEKETFYEEFCECHESEIDAIQAKCKHSGKKEVGQIYGECIEEIRDRRAPYKSIDGKYKQFVICDNEIREELKSCVKDKMSELNVNYDPAEKDKDYWECVYKFLLQRRKKDEAQEEKERPGVDKKKKG